MRTGPAALLIALAAGFQPAGAQNSAPPSLDHEIAPWLRYGFELRGRFERDMGMKYNPGADDSYYLHRLRIQFAAEPNSWLRFFIQGQDTHAPGYSRGPAPASYANTFDLRQGYAEVGRFEGDSRWGVRVGRQEMRFGEARLIGPSNWSNSARSWDAVRVGYRQGRTRLDCFAASLVVLAASKFDEPQLRNGFYGCYSSRSGKKSTVDAYLLWRTNSRVRDENGRLGGLDLYTAGARAAGTLAPTLRYDVEMAFQVGHYAADVIRAWAGHWHLTWAMSPSAWKPQLLLEYNHASGDADPRDGRHGTFDPLWPTNHAKYGLVDRITWRNVHDVRAGVQFSPIRRWTFIEDVHNFWLASRADGLYTSAGALIAINRSATSTYIGPELDFQATYDATPRIQIGFGYAHLFPGPYLHQTIKQNGSTYPYIMWTYRY